jgi:GNAT superfamily N-acetyltransferase
MAKTFSGLGGSAPQRLCAPLHATIELARRVDRAEIDFCALAGSTHSAVDTLDAGGGRALFSRQGSPLNKVLGLGLGGAVSDDELDRIEAFYVSRNTPTQIELCPLAYGDLAPRLCARGFIVEAFENELGMAIGPAKAGSHEYTPIDVTLATPDQDDLWTRVVAEGFVACEPLVGGAPDAKPLTIEMMVEMMSPFTHPAIRRYLAWIDDEPAGGGAAWADKGVLGIFGTATLPRFRRRGVQSALSIAAIEDARESADLAIATTAPGSTSQRTFERLGFQVLYTRALFVKA